MSIRVVEEVSRAQVLPNIRDERATVSSYYAHLACDPDLRATSIVLCDLAEKLFLEVVED